MGTVLQPPDAARFQNDIGAPTLEPIEDIPMVCMASQFA